MGQREDAEKRRRENGRRNRLKDAAEDALENLDNLRDRSKSLRKDLQALGVDLANNREQRDGLIKDIEKVDKELRGLEKEAKTSIVGIEKGSTLDKVLDAVNSATELAGLAKKSLSRLASTFSVVRQSFGLTTGTEKRVKKAVEKQEFLLAESDRLSDEARSLQQEFDRNSSRNNDSGDDDNNLVGNDPEGNDGFGSQDEFSCFVSGTPILMADGTNKAIEKVNVDDEVMAFDNFGKLQPRRVTDIFEHHNCEVVRMGDIEATLAHPFLTEDGQYIPLGNIDQDGVIVLANGMKVPIGDLEAVERKTTVYNFTVDDLHTYVAGGYRVHNRKPVVLDLNRDGDVTLIDVEDSKAMFFANSGKRHGWVAPEDGLLAIDADGSGRIDQDNEIAFVGWDERARTDLEGLALAFDSNEDGNFDAKDDRFGDFSIWQDRNSDGVQQDGELQSLADAGVTAIDVSVDLSSRVPILSTEGGNTVHRNTAVDYANGSEGIAADVAFGHAKDAAAITEQLSRIVPDRAVGRANGQKRQAQYDQRDTFVGGSANAA